MFHDDMIDMQYLVKMFEASRFSDELWGSTIAHVLGVKPHSFYFDRNHIDQVIIDTAHEFYKSGVLDFPFDDNIFVFDNAIDESYIGMAGLTKKMREGYIIQRISTMKSPILKQKIDNTIKAFSFSTEFLIQKFTEVNHPVLGIKPIPDPFVFFLADSASHKQFGGIALIPLLPQDQIGKSNMDIAQKSYLHSIGTLLGAMMLLNTKYAKKTEHIIDEKLNKSREKKSKTQLSGYIKIDLGRQFSVGDGLESGSKKRPHWRRGHIRRLADKIIPVSPCIINWDGEEPEEKIYKVAV